MNAISIGMAQTATRSTSEAARWPASVPEAGSDVTRRLGAGRGEVTRERLEGGGPYRGVLLPVASADADAADHLAVDLDREAPHEHREAARVHGVDAEGLIAGQGGAGRGLVEPMGGPPMAGRGEGLGDGDLHAGDPRPGHAVERDRMTAVVADADRLGH